MTSTKQTNLELNISGYSRVPSITTYFQIGKSTWWKWVSEGKAPAPIKLGPKTTVWKNSEILALAASLEANSAKEG